jgi:putative transposase
MRTNYPRHLHDFDYTGIYRYFLTFCLENRRAVFVGSDAVALVWSQFLRAATDKSFAIIVCVFMPDHSHLVVEGLADSSKLKQFISRAKQLSGYHYKQRSRMALWQRYGYERVLRKDESTPAVVAYVLENRVRAGLVRSVHEYPHIRSSVYGREELIEYAYGARSEFG